MNTGHNNGGYIPQEPHPGNFKHHQMPQNHERAPQQQRHAAPAQQRSRQQSGNQGHGNCPQQNQHNFQPRSQDVQIDITGLTSIIEGAREGFEQIAKTVGLDIKFFEEALYAKQLIEANYNNSRDKKYTLAAAHPDTIRNALILVANSGLTLNPQLGLAYLVPRWNKNAGRLECHLEPSYKGLRRLGMDSGAIDTAVAELVYEADEFSWVDRYSKPVHNFDPFKTNRGNLRGGYCLARRPDGSFICTPVNMALLNKIQALSKGGIWNEWFEQMVAKSIIRQGFKDWPITSTGPLAARLSAMQDYLRKVDEHSDSTSEIVVNERYKPMQPQAIHHHPQPHNQLWQAEQQAEYTPAQ